MVFLIDSSSKQVFWVEWDIYDSSTTMRCGEIQAWYDSRDEKEVQDAAGRGENTEYRRWGAELTLESQQL